MKERPTKENTLYLPIKQVYFDQIIEGTKKVEYREIKEGITANRYLLRDNDKKYILNPDVTEQGKEYFIDDYNNGNFPFIPKPYKYLSLAVGYAKERDTAIVEVTDYSFEPHLIRSNLFAFWTIAYHLGKVIEVHRANEKIEKEKQIAEEKVEEEKIPHIVKRTKVFYKECAIAGWSFHDADDFWSELDEGVELALIRQGDNKYDRNAVAVALADDYDGCPDDFDFDLIIGYVPRTENEFIAQMMDLGYNDMFTAQISTVKNHGKYDERLRMTIYIQSKEGFEDPYSTNDILYAMRLLENNYDYLTTSLKEKGCVHFRWGGYPPWEFDLPNKGDRVLCINEHNSEMTVYLMHVIGKDVSASPFLDDPEEELNMEDDCSPYVLTNIMGPIVLPLDELSFLDDEDINDYQPGLRLSKYATKRIMEILSNIVNSTKSGIITDKDLQLLPTPAG